MRVYVTGASGFVGQNLSAYLEDQKIQVKKLSLRNPEWRAGISLDGTALIHLAGKAHDTTNTTEDEAYSKINRDLTIEVFHEFLESEIRDFFFFSSVKAAADTVDGVLTEDLEKSPRTPYGKSKAEAEDYLLSQELPKGKRLFIIRPTMIHGPGNKGNLNLLYKVVKKGVPWPLASFNNKRSFLSIDNLCFLIQQMLENPQVPSGIYNFADDETVSTNELIAVISEIQGKKPKLWKIPKGLIRLLAGVGDVLHLPLNTERLQKLTENYVVSNRKIKAILDIKTLPLPADVGIRKTIKSLNE